MFKSMWERQFIQQQNWYDVEGLPSEERTKVLNELMLGLHEVVNKLQRTLGRDRYHVLRAPPLPTPEDVADGGVDVFKYLISIMQLHGITAEQFTEAFTTKSDVVDNKWRCEQADLSANVEVVCIDLDGCVTDWIAGFLAFCRSQGRGDVSRSGINEPMMEPLKDAFHGGGGFLTLQPIPWAIEAIRTIRSMGYKTVIVTARPYHQFRRVYSDTMSWLKRYNVEYDHLMFESNKANAILRIRPAHVVGFVEDRGKHALEVALTGTRVYKLPFHIGNENVEHDNITKVGSWAEIVHCLKEKANAAA